jgi:hypothetical protein
LGQDWYAPTEVNSVVLNAQTPADCINQFAERSAWSPDGRRLGYSDSEGLWLWDVLTPDAQPQLLVPTTDSTIPFARYFSPMGRYLAVSEGDLRQTLDLVSGEILPDGLVAPDDRTLLKFDTNAVASELEVCSLTPYNCVPIAPMYFYITDEQSGEVEHLYGLSHIADARWENRYQFLTFACVSEEPKLCALYGWSNHYGWGWYGGSIDQGYAYDYDAQNDTLAVVRTETTIAINNQEYDLSHQLDSEITDVIWLESLFYRE